MAWPASMLLVGCGNMGGAMLAGWLASGLPADRFTVVDPMLENAPPGVKLLREFPEGRFDAVLLAIKPQLLGEVAPEAAGNADKDTVVLSILAGAELASLAAHFSHAEGCVRIMPNLAAAIGKSPIALADAGLDEQRRADVTGLMAPLGTPEWFDEGQFDLLTALAGSGPAFVYRFIDALASGAAALGLDPAKAERLALATVEGASLLASSSELSPGELARKVTSPGGTTEAGLQVLDADAALAKLVEATLRAARDRGAELAADSKRN